MSRKGDWSDHDNKKYIGKLDRQYVARSEEWEMEYFIDDYLESRGCKVDNSNRDIVTNALEKYEGRAPIKREDLKAFLDKKFDLKP